MNPIASQVAELRLRGAIVTAHPSSGPVIVGAIAKGALGLWEWNR